MHQREYGFINKMTERENAYFANSDFLAATTLLNLALKNVIFSFKTCIPQIPHEILQDSEV